MKISTVTETDLANAMAQQLHQWTGIPMETLVRTARNEFLRRGETLQTLFGPINLVKANWMPKDRALMVTKH